MITGRCFIAGYIKVILICAVTAFLCGSYALAEGQQATTSKPAHFQVFTLRNISAEQGKGYLSRIGIDTVSQLPTPNSLLVTASPEDLIKAAGILKVVDINEQFVIEPILPASEINSLPAQEKIALKAGDASIGSFSNPPGGISKNRVIIDVLKDSVVVIAPASKVEEIISAIMQLREEKSSAAAAKSNKVTGGVEAKDSNDVSGELFNKLLGTIREAEKTATEPNKVVAIKTTKVKKPIGGPKENLPQIISEPNLPVAATVKPIAASEVNKPATADRKPYEPEPLEAGDAMLDLNLPERLNITDLLSLVGEYLKVDYMYDQTKIQGDVTLRLRGPIKVKDLYPLVESVLKFKGFVMTRKGNLVTIVPAAEASEIDPALLHDKDGQVKYGDVIITRIFKLKQIDAGSAQKLLNDMKLSVSVSAIPETSTLIVTCYAYRMSRVEEVLDMIDSQAKHFKFRQLKYTTAAALAPKVKLLAEQLGAMSINIAQEVVVGPTRVRRAATPMETMAITPAGSKPSVYLGADERTNRILIIGFEEQLAIVDSLIDILDVEQQDIRVLRLYDIQNVGAEEVKKKLEELGIIGASASNLVSRYAGVVTSGEQPAPVPAPQAPATGGGSQELLMGEPQVVIVEATNSLLVNAAPEQHVQIATIISYVDNETQQRAIPYEIYPLENQSPTALAGVLQKLIQETITDREGKIQQTIKKTEENIIIVPDENTFSIIVYANKKNQEWIKKLIKTLDRRRPQVLIDVMLVEVTKDDTFTYDLDLVSKMSGTTAKVAGITDIVGISSIPAGEKATEFFSSTPGATTTGTGFYADRHIQALLKLMQSKNYGRVLAQPKILVNDNEKGTINKKTTQYVARSSATVYAQATGQTGETPISTSYTFDQFESGIELNITPHISEGNLLRLEIKMTRSSQEAIIKGASVDTPPPEKKEDNIDTIVTVPDKSTIILGGVTQLDQSKKVSKVPGLGDLPLIGGLFRSIDNSDSQKKLYIFVRANILRPGENRDSLTELEKISKSKKEGFEKNEKEFQKYQSWPAVKPEPLDPTKVLEAE
jgi:general secretion pathway protein D